MLFDTWIEFVTYPGDPDRVLTRDQRLDTADAARLGPDGRYPEDADLDEEGAVVPLSTILGLSADDDFEAMAVSDAGGVFIWTRDWVWCLYGDRGLERLKAVPREPEDFPP